MKIAHAEAVRCLVLLAMAIIRLGRIVVWRGVVVNDSVNDVLGLPTLTKDCSLST